MPRPAPRRETAAARVAALLLASSLACATTGGGASPAGAVTPEAPGAVLGRFVAALDAGRWGDAQGLLSARWRAAYTPSRLAADYAGAGPLAREAAAHVRSALGAGGVLQVGDGRAVLPVAGGRAVLVAEAAGWRVDALEGRRRKR